MTTLDIISLYRLDPRLQLARDVRIGLTTGPKWLPPKYFYDKRGSELFEEITELPEYYQARTETEILAGVVDDLVAELRPEELTELGSGASRKTRLLIEAMGRHGTGQVYRPFDVSEDALREASNTLRADYPWLRIQGVVGDFDQHLGALPREGRNLIAFLGSTLGNLQPAEQEAFVRAATGGFEPGDAFLLGVDLAPGPNKSVEMVEAAYNDAAGVTAAFNRNVLHVLNRELGADFPVDDFEHRARYEPDKGWIQMNLRATRPVTVRFPTMGLSVDFATGEELRTEISCKFTREQVEGLFSAAGLGLRRWDTDPEGLFALALGVA